MRKLLILAAVASLAACARQSEEVGRAQPETGTTDTMTTRTGGYDTTRTARRPDTITTRGDSALVNRSVPDTSGRPGRTGADTSRMGPHPYDTTTGRTDTSFARPTQPDTSMMRHDSM